MNHSFKVGFSFGLTSATITTLGLMVGLQSGTNSQLAVIGGVLTIAVADAFSDALGIHISEESENRHTKKEIWSSTLSTFLTKAIFASLFIVPVLLFPLATAVIISIVIGLLLISVFSYVISKQQNIRRWPVVGEHLLITAAVIVTTHYLGKWIANTFS